MRVPKILFLVVTSLFLVGGAAAGDAVPRAVSPGATEGAGIAIADRCPTFSWGECPGAKSYELTVYRVGDDGLEVRPVFTESIPATALSWTPSLAYCLEAGGKYAWSVRAIHNDGSSEWSEPSLFQVVAGPGSDRERVRPVFATPADPDAEEAVSSEAGESPGAEGEAESLEDPATKAAPAGTKLSVDGNVDAVSFSGSGSSLSSVDADTLDTLDSTAFVQKTEADTEAELEALLGDVANVLTDTETAATASALAADGANCAAGEFAAGVSASGAAQGCAEPADAHAFASGNTRLGDGALAANTSGSDNTASGYQALLANTTGYNNTAGGYQALLANTTGYNNTASGKSALRSNTTGYNNTANGTNALENNTEGDKNTASGAGALNANTTGSGNTATGFLALVANTTGGGNTANGIWALLSNTTGNNNTASGYQALLANTTGAENTATGFLALKSNTTGGGNTANGNWALLSNTTGYNNTASGNFALMYNTTGSSNLALGYRAGYAATTGSENIFLGSGAEGVAAEANTIRIGGTSVGTGSKQQNRAFINGIRGVSVAGGQTVVIDASGQLGSTPGGAGSGVDADTLDTLDSAAFLQKTEADTEAELEALLTDVTNLLTDTETTTTAAALAADGADCPAGEFAAGVNAAGAAQGCAVPADAHGFATANTRLGAGALAANTTGASNTASGYSALGSNTMGFDNTASGSLALSNNTTGSGNTASGAQALASNTTGSFNTTSGYLALSANTTGSNNLALGVGAGTNATTGSNNIFLVNAGAAGDAGKIRIGAGYQTATYVAGIRGVTTGVADAIPVMIDSAGQLGTVSSSRRYKEDIRDMESASERLLALRPVTFRYKREFAGGEKPVQFGLIAEEVAEVFPELVVYNAAGEPETVKYHLLSPLLLNELQKLRARVRELEPLEARLERLEALVAAAPRIAAERRPPPEARPGARGQSR